MAAKKNIFVVWFLIIPEIVIFFLGLWVTILIRYGENATTLVLLNHAKLFSGIFVLWVLVFFIHGLFEPSTFRRYSTLIFSLISAMAVNILLAIIYLYFQPSFILTPRRFLLVDVGITTVFLCAWLLLGKYLLKNRLIEDVYLFSFNHELDGLGQEITSNPYLGYKVAGHLNENNIETALVSKNSAIILPDSVAKNGEVLKKLYALRTSGVEFYNFREFFERLSRKVFLSELDEAWFLENINYGEKRFYNIAKRFMDIAFGVIGFIFFLISWPICALLIKLTSPGPVLFIQGRVGKGGKIFNVYKYRTMSGGATNTWTKVNDPRITKVGKFLRKSRIDEWPQFINLLLGNMSLVGPRPEQPNLVSQLKLEIPFYDERHLVKPGLTGWAQINNIYAGSSEETTLKLQYDLYYIKHRGFLFDSEIILKTLYYIFTWKGR